MAVSARTGYGLSDLLGEVAGRLELVARPVRLRFRVGDTRGIAAVYASGRVLSHQVEGDEVWIEAELPERALARYREHFL